MKLSKYRRSTLLLAGCLSLGLVLQAQTKKRLIDEVNPFIGTTNYGTTNPGAVLPNGLMSVTPFNVMGSKEYNKTDKDDRWWSTPYTAENKFFTGFSHVNLSGVGCPELGSILISASSGELDVDYKHYGSPMSRESAKPGYYRTTLDKYQIQAEVTATLRSALASFTFDKGGKSHILVNLGQGLTNESGATVRFLNDSTIVGSKLMGTFCYNPQAVFNQYFAIRISRRAPQAGYWKIQPAMHGVEAEWDKDNGKYKLYPTYRREMSGNDVGVWFSFDTKPGEKIYVQTGVSFVSEQNALLNLNTEQPTLDFAATRARAEEAWEKVLSVIEVEGGTPEERTVFYTSLYHLQIHPNILQDVNGEYPQMGSLKVAKTSHDRYTVYSLWDTYRNVHPLLSLLYPRKQLAMVQTMLDMYKESGWLPKWELYGQETFTMEGDPAIIVINDTWQRGIRDFDTKLAYEAMLRGATTPGKDNKLRPDFDDYVSRGYVPLREKFDNSVSHALEYYIADWNLSQFASALGKKKDAQLFARRASGYKHYYDKESGLLRPILPDGKFITPFHPTLGRDFEPNPGFHEGNSWNYSFYIPHDIYGLAKLMGGERKFVDKLQSVFDKDNYDPANEPDIAYPYLFTYFPK
ncbi:MAG: glycoside hydrolase family 92 protein, partial [Porphyromonadaceae bacterium]|nr:glycoside hydrolase family 92 protein [Porphyromonadaceae bacterium]